MMAGKLLLPNKKRRNNRKKDIPPPPVATYIPPPTTTTTLFEPYLLLLVGLQGSGKSTFASYLQTSMPWKYVRINQDTLGNRSACEELTRSTLLNLKEPRIPIIDRCNVNSEQRRSFLNIAQKEFKIPVDCIVFQYNLETCVGRCKQRGNSHETLRPGEERQAVERMADLWNPPSLSKNVTDVVLRQGKRGRDNVENFRSVRYVSSFEMVDQLLKEYLKIE
mmetsp:Transcript_20538/g.30508  ORF Transcript_20538/g.30508 Transcript_20538/m.30508 type:complete len:221 (-) Transcript_20538:37-699(-)